MYALMTRRSQADGQVYGPDETLDVADALRTYTINGAYLTYLVVLDLEDIRMLEEDPELLFGMRDRILLTLSDGLVRYPKEGWEE
jgi:hypothetical protein